MVFSSVVFLFVFLPIVISVYFIANDTFKNIWLLMVSLLFYSWGEPKCIILMLISIFVNYILGIIINKTRDKKMSKVMLVFAVVVNIGILLYFKYFNFFISNINRFLAIKISAKNIALPVGISFYTFQSMSYVIDVYRNNVRVQKNILKLVMNNFNYPYISRSVKDFWRRWHISLSTWFKDYVYIPLGGSRCGKFRACLNLSIVFFLTGFWHGASWNFIVWGLYYAVFLISERGGVLEKLPVVV